MTMTFESLVVRFAVHETRNRPSGVNGCGP